MAGEIATAYIAIVPSAKGFGGSLTKQIGPQATAVGTKAGQDAGKAFSQAASKESANWLETTAKNAIKNVTLYGSMYAAIQGIRSGIRSMFDAMVGFNAQLEQSTLGFETMLGSASAAQDQMQWIKDFAKETPFQYDDLTLYSQQLIAMGFSAEESRKVLQATGDAAAALGRGSESISRINLALGQMWTKGKVQSQEMLQLTEAGIGSWEILADAYGASVEDVQEAVTAGLIKASDAVPALIEGMNARFGGLMEKQSATYAGIVGNIQDTLQQQFAESGEGLFRELTVQARQFLDALDDPEVLNMMHRLGELLADGVHMLAEAGRLAWQFRDGILAVGVALVASKLLSSVSQMSPLAATTWYSATRAQEAYRAGLSRTSALQAGITAQGASMLRGVGQTAGLIATVDGIRRVSEAATEGEVSGWGFAEAIGGGALAGAALGSVLPGVGTAVGAVGGAIVGLTGSMLSYRAAINAANEDTSAMEDALRSLGVEANLAALTMAGVTNEQLELAGGASALLDAMKSGTYSDYVADLEAQTAALREQAAAQLELSAASADRAVLVAGLIEEAQLAGESTAALDEEFANLTATGYELDESYASLIASANELDSFLSVLADNTLAVADAQEQVVASGYQAAYAADMQTGALGALTAAAWDAVVAEGGLSAEALTAAARMEGLAGVAGYATQMIAGIPVGTQINFSTNAMEISAQIAGLIATRNVLSNTAAGSYAQAGIDAQLEAERKKLQSALTSAVSTLTLPTKGSAAGKAVAGAAKSVVDDAARQLERDRTAQLRFGDAFGAIMEAALGGNFDQYRDRLEAQIVSLTRDGYTKAANALKQLSVALTQATLDYAALTNKLKAATDAYDDLNDRMRDQYAASRDLILGLGQVTDAQSFDQLAYLLGETTARASEYQAVLAQLRDQGLSEDLWNQLAQAGPESMGLAQSILAQGQEGIDQLNLLSGGLVDAAESMGSLVADSMYAQGVEAMRAYIEGLQSQSSALEAQLETIANNVLNTTAGAITPGNAGYSQISAAPQTTVNEYNLSISAESLGDIKTVQDFIAMLEQTATTQLVNQAGTVTS